MKKIYLLLVACFSLLSCNKEKQVTETLVVQQISTELSTVGGLFNYADGFSLKGKVGSNAMSKKLLADCQHFIFINNAALFPVKDITIVDNSTININYKINDFNITSVLLKEVSPDMIFFMFIFDDKKNEGIVKNGFYISNIKKHETIFVKCLANQLPYSKKIRFNDLSSISIVDNNLKEEWFLAFEDLDLSHVGFIEDGIMSNIRFPSVKMKREYLTIRQNTTVKQIFSLVDNIILSFSLRSYFNVCEKSKREIVTYKWKLGYNNLDY